ncbi:tetratricopeptide repeat protein [Actinomadura hibisca]|uniref:tetratricopeptide repeat protein n=1 Tax=Actinomadura hibisca TaxID=68565 RepID=UPI0008361EB3|nr:tetratricopeptide repeat protein [Actinomadura hibisca]
MQIDRVPRRPLYAAVAALAAAVVAVVGVGALRDAPGPPAPIDGAAPGTIGRYQQALRAAPDDHRTWAALGAAYVQQARTTLDPSYYPRAQGALERSLRLAPTGNDQAMTGMGALANARHEFASAAQWGRRAARANPASPDAQGVLADAYTQLGDYPAATRAVTRMNELAPGVPAFTRASYERQQRGDVAGARALLRQALGAAYLPADVAFCRYYLGELAFQAGDLAEAEEHYRAAATADASFAPAVQGVAKTAALRGDTPAALRGYQTLVARAPLPQYLTEYAQLLHSAGQRDQAAAQERLLATQERLQAANGLVDDLAASEHAADTGDKVRALRHAEAEWKRRRSVLVADALAWALHLNGRDAEALGYARQATRLGWRNAALYHHRAEIHQALGDRAAAAADRATAHAINPRFTPEIPAIGRPS